MTFRRLPLLLLVCLFVASATALSACGGDDGGGDTSDDAGTSEQSDSASAPAGDPEEAIQEWFTAARLGEAADKCSLESEEYQVLMYGESGQACLEDASNTQAQPVWAEEVVVVDVQTNGDSVTATVQPNASTPHEATVGLVREGDGWLIASFQ